MPMTLNIRWTMAARLAVRLVPTAASRQVTQVPMFWPNRINSEVFRLTAPAAASDCRMPMLAALLCRSAVTSVPTSTPTTGLEA